MADKKIDQAGPKAPLGLIPLYCLVGLARVLQYGAKKYAPGNWFEADMVDGAGERYYSAALRHLMAMQGPDGVVTLGSLTARDAESLLPHIDHAICSLVMLRGILQKTGGFGYDPGKGVGVA